jgi:cysteine desulfurase
LIYLDNSATTKVKPEILEAMIPYFTDKWYNPSSLYSPSVEVKNDIESARETVGNFIGAGGNEIYFCSCGSEADNWAIKGVAKIMAKKGKRHLITTTIEHHAVLNSMKALEKDGFEITYLPVDKYGLITLKQVQDVIRPDTALVSIMYANNEIGSIEPISEIGEVCHKNNVLFHTDAVQAVSNIKIDVKKQNIDLLSMSAHKFGAPKGIGALYIKNGIEFTNLIDGGAQMDGRRAGTENVPYIIGMAKAVELCDISAQKTEELCDKRDYFIKRLVEEFGCTVNGSLEHRLPNNINVTFPQNITGESLLYTLDMSDIFISVGSACNSHSFQPSYVLEAIGLSDEEAMRSVRFSLPDDITYEDIDYVIQEIGKTIKLIEYVKE